MFFIGIFGVQNKARSLKEFDVAICADCERWSRAELVEEYTYFHFFFIPLYKWNKKYYVRLRCCQSLYEADAEYAKELKTSDTIDFDKLKKIGSSANICPDCGRPVEPGFLYCPYCGGRL